MNRFLFKYHTTPQTTTDISLANGSQVAFTLDFLVQTSERKYNLQKHSHELHAKDKQFQENDPVMAKNFSQSPPWITGKILKRSEAATLLVELPDGKDIVNLTLTNQGSNWVGSIHIFGSNGSLFLWVIQVVRSS